MLYLWLIFISTNHTTLVKIFQNVIGILVKHQVPLVYHKRDHIISLVLIMNVNLFVTIAHVPTPSLRTEGCVFVAHMPQPPARLDGYGRPPRLLTSIVPHSSHPLPPHPPPPPSPFHSGLHRCLVYSP